MGGVEVLLLVNQLCLWYMHVHVQHNIHKGDGNAKTSQGGYPLLIINV